MACKNVGGQKIFLVGQWTELFEGVHVGDEGWSENLDF